MNKITDTLEHKLTPWLRLVVPAFMALITYNANVILNKLTSIEQKQQVIEKKLIMFKGETDLLKYRIDVECKCDESEN